jgi:hypothetical protein
MVVEVGAAAALLSCFLLLVLMLEVGKGVAAAGVVCSFRETLLPN